MKEVLRRHKTTLLMMPVAVVAVALIWPNLSAQTACVTSVDRPCYDRSSGKNMQFMKLGTGANTFAACAEKASVGDAGVFSVKTSRCAQEEFSYCYDGKSKNFLRKFEGTCKAPPAVSVQCAALAETQQFFFDICASNGYDNVCFNKYTSEYQGCDTNARDECTTYNVNREQNVRCAAAR